MPTIGWIVLMVGGGYALLCLAAVLWQDKLIFFPERGLSGDPSLIGLDFTELNMRAEDGTRIHGWYLPAPARMPDSSHAEEAQPGRETLPRLRAALFCHGNAGNIAQRLDTLRLLHELGLAVLIFDYRGYGRSGGRPSEGGLHRDARAAWRQLTEELGHAPEEVVVWGRSLGGAVAAELAAELAAEPVAERSSAAGPGALIVESCFTSAAELGARIYPWLPVRQLARIHFDAAASVRRLRCPKLFVHSIDDEVVPYGLGLRLFKAAAEPKEWLKIRGSHNDGFLTAGDRYRDVVRRFLARVE